MSCYRTLRPMCPNKDCHHILLETEMEGTDGEDLFALAPEEGRAEVICPTCGMTYWVEGGYTPEYTTALDPDDL